ncbi:DEAD/DEAH box helicase family protein [Tumidithrix helvetica PCC 7403]|uniref:helicase-related protein n=1 Tax=Tumidithrix helvetica TaxID=3457545 RepID=UPI003CB543FD
MVLPDYIDNDRHKLEITLQELVLQQRQTDLDIVTGLFQIEAWIRLEEAINQLTNLRLLIGRDPTILPAEQGNIDLNRFFCRDLQQQLENSDFNLANKQQIERLIAYFNQEQIQVRLYGVNVDKAIFLHAKAYIFNDYCIIGSSNFTPSGLDGNTELNVLIKQNSISHDLRTNWFSKFWNDPSVDIDYKAKLIDTLEASKFGRKPYTPYQVFIKALYELFKEETTSERSDRTTLELANFQQQGFEQAVRMIDKHNACMVADAVGLGKTYIGMRLIEHYLQEERRPGYVPRALIICPAQLRDLLWNKKLDEFGIKADIVSQEEMGRKNFDIRSYTKHDIIVLDESHNFRNSGTNRYVNLQKLVGSGKRHKKIVLMTATPINNSIYDLYHQVMLMTRNTSTYYREWGIGNLTSFFKELNNGNIEITELLMQTMVRRSRLDVIKRQKAGEQILIGGKEIHFPKRQLENFTYNFEDAYQGLYAGIADKIDRLNLAPYNIRAFKRKPDKQDRAEIKRNEALAALMKSLWLKRLESSLVAFNASITRQELFQAQFDNCLQRDKLLTGKNFRKILAAEEDEEENISIQEILDSLEEVNKQEYDIKQLQTKISEDSKILRDILGTLQIIQENVSQGKDSDRKLLAFKDLLLEQHLKGKKILVFSYFRDTADYLCQELIKDKTWLESIGNSTIEIITGKTKGSQRAEKVKRFAPKANCEDPEERQKYFDNQIDILICTDVLSEGQNLQDAGVLVNYDLHWNPVRMIQRAGRIDRLGTEFENLFIYNCFPEEGLENLLGLVKRLQERIATIDREIGLDGSVLGETISDRSIEELRKLKKANTDAEKAVILEELEQLADLISLDEMRFPLSEFLQQKNIENIREIPMGIHSTRKDGIDGIFLAFNAKGRSVWHFYPRINGAIITDRAEITTQKRKIFKMIQCREMDYPKTENLPPAEFDNSIFTVLEGAVDNLVEAFQKQQSSARVKPKLSPLLLKIYKALTNINFLATDEFYLEAKKRVLKIIESVTLRTYEKELKNIWEEFVKDKNLVNLVERLDEYFVENQLGQELEEEDQETILDIINKEDVQLVCYEWFKPNE